MSVWPSRPRYAHRRGADVRGFERRLWSVWRRERGEAETRRLVWLALADVELHDVIIERACGKRVRCRVRASPSTPHALPFRDQMKMFARPRANNVEQLFGAVDACICLCFFAKMGDHSLQQAERYHHVELRTLDAMNGVDGDAASVSEHFAEEVNSADIRGPLPA